MQQPFEATLAAGDLALAPGTSDRIQRDLQFMILRMEAEDGTIPLTRAQMLRLQHAIANSSPSAVMELVQKHKWLGPLVEGGMAAMSRERFGRSGSRRSAPYAMSSALTVAGPSDGGSTGPSSNNPGVPDPRNESDILLALVQSELGTMFIDQTRFTPAGFAMGEHVYSMSLAPGEEVTLEQKTYTQRETSLEELTENETSVEREMTSAVSTEITNSFTRQLTDSATRGLTVGGSLGVSYVVTVSANAQVSNSVTQADQRTTANSVKQTRGTTEKVASKLRNLHKTTFRVSTVDRFETTAKRVVRNPNVYSAIDLVYFKILKRLAVRRERAGVRLCWAPAIPAPGRLLEAEMEAMRRKFLSDELSRLSIPQPPAEPTPASAPGPLTSGVTDVELTQWDWFNGSMRADYDLTVPSPGAGYTWDGNTQSVSDSISIVMTGWGWRTPGASVSLVGTPRPQPDGSLIVKVHAGADWGPAGAHLYVSLQAGFHVDTSALNAEDQTRREAWQTAMAAWRSQTASSRSAAEAAAATTFETWSVARRGKLDERVELLRILVRSWFAADARDEFEELLLWQELIDWEFASMRLFPGWWNGTSPFDPSQEDMTFANASWAQVYLPIVVGRELDALRWIYNRGVQTPASPPLETIFATIVQELEQYRLNTFGDQWERPIVTPPAAGGQCPAITSRVACLGTWTEFIPTDGTHVEMIQSASHAADTFGRQRLTDDSLDRARRLDTMDSENALRTKASDNLGQVTGVVTVNIEADGSASSGTP